METKYIIEFGEGKNKFWLKDAPVWEITLNRREAKKISDINVAKKYVDSHFMQNLKGHVTEY